MKILTWILKKLKGMTTETIKGIIPKVGIFAFAGCSTHALAEFFREMARTPSTWYDVASWLVEGFTAYVITLLVAQVKIALASVSGKKGASKEKRRWGIAFSICYTVIAAITIAVSGIANTREFNGNPWLGSLFPALCIACAIAVGLDEEAKAKQSETTSGTEGTTTPPKPKQKQEFIAWCGCGFSKSYNTERKRTNGKNGHRRGGCKEEWIE